MLQSMTGYVTKSVDFSVDSKKSISLDFTLKSLNSKFFENNIKLPHIFYSLENEIIKILKKELKRGTVYLYVGMENPDAFKTNIEISMESLDGYIKAINRAKDSYKIEDNIKISDIIRLPNIFTVHEATLTSEQRSAFLAIISDLAKELVQERNREGAELLKDIKLRISRLKNEIEEISKAFEIYFDAKKANISQKIEGGLVNDSDFAENQRKILYSVLDRNDIHEEIVRFRSHVGKLEDIINLPEIEKGKSLDFTLQELAREINTILSKTTSANISHIGLNIKVEIEKTREQAQNLV